MNPTILLPELPDTTDPKAVKDYLAAHQKILADKQKDDYESLTGAKGLIFPVGSWYTQYPSVKSNDEAVAFPESEEPANKFGGVWTEPFSGEYTFFRTTGTDGQERINGKSLDQLQGFFIQQSEVNAGSGGSIRSASPTSINCSGKDITDVPISGPPVTDGVNGVPRIGTKTEPINYIKKVWYRES